METNSEQETEQLGEELGNRLLPGSVILLDGDLGAGKTVFARGVARGLGVGSSIQSPTFTLLNVYEGRLPFYHFDLYRLDSAEELFELGVDEYLDGEGVSLVEWAGKFAAYLDLPALCVLIEVSGAEGRRIVFTADGEPYETIMRDFMRDLPAGG